MCKNRRECGRINLTVQFVSFTTTTWVELITLKRLVCSREKLNLMYISNSNDSMICSCSIKNKIPSDLRFKNNKTIIFLGNEEGNWVESGSNMEVACT